MKKIYILLLLLMLTKIFAAEFNWFSQRDERWKKNRLGQARKSTIGSSGCVLSCLSMLLNAEATNPRMTPDELNDWLRKNGGFSGAKMRWQIPGQIDGSGNGLELVAQSTRMNDWTFLSEQMKKGNKVIVKVRGRRSHWVLVTKQTGPYNKASSYQINDPGTSTYKERTLAFFGGFKSARSYSGFWLDEETFSMDSEIQVVPVETDELFLYDLNKKTYPADVYVQIKNSLPVQVTGYFILGLFDKDDGFLNTVDFEYATVDSCGHVDLMYEMEDITEILENKAQVKIIYSKYFSQMPSRFDTLPLIKNGKSDYPKPEETNDSVDLE